ncbi:hypothetical protein [Microcoleus sp. D2_18a_D3]|uniref:hypothetical protein n=1 Tax=Microcoleus sp. D2_18a_D3 TaxID=3055330 RepID=UPI002FD30316
MPYCQAYECLTNPDSTLAELLNAFEDVIAEYIYVATMAGRGLRESSEEDLLKLLAIKLALKSRIQKLCLT